MFVSWCLYLKCCILLGFYILVIVSFEIMYIFLYGADTFRSAEKLSTIKNNFTEKDSSGAGLSYLDYGENATTADQFKDLLSARGLFSTKKLIIIRDAISGQTPEKQKELLSILKTDSSTEKDEDTSVVFFESSSPKKNGALYKFLFSKAKKQEFAPLETMKLSSWALEYLKNIAPNKTIEKRALDMLIAATGSDLYLLSSELGKLSSYRAAAETISANDVQLLVKSRINSTIFQAIEALTSGNKAIALTLLHQQIENGEDIFYILSMYTYHVRTLLKIGDCYWNGITSPAQIAQTTKLHPYIIQKSLSQLRNLSPEKTKSIFRSLAMIDHQAKTGKVNPIQAIDTFIISL